MTFALGHPYGRRFKKGDIPWNKWLKGYRHSKKRVYSKEGKEKFSKVWKGKRIGKNNPFYGRKHTSEAISKIKKARARQVITKEHIRKSLGKRGMSSLEKRINSVIVKYDLPYKFVGDGKFFIEKKNPDFINTNGEKIAVEVYSRRHKENLRGITIDEWKVRRTEVFNKYGWDIIYIEDYQTNKESDILYLMKGGY